MVGRDVVLRIDKQPGHPGEALLDLDHVSVVDSNRHERVHRISFQVRAGEIFGLAGIDGNGQFELVDGITGLLRVTHGAVRFAGADITRQPPSARTEAGIAYVPQDRQGDGLVMQFDLIENTMLRDFRRWPFSRYGWLRRRAAEDHARTLITAIRRTAAHPAAQSVRSVRRQPTEGDPGARSRPRSKTADCRAAHARSGRRRH